MANGLAILAAVANNGVIGRENGLPFNLSDDLKRFREITLNRAVVMGSTTFDSIIGRNHKPLPNRENIVLTRSPKDRKCDGVKFISNFGDILVRAKRETVFVIGGGQIYNLALPAATKLFLTRVHTEVEGDVFFPKAPRWNPDEWELESSTDRLADKRNEFSFTWEIYNRKPDRYIYMPNVRTVDQLNSMQEIREAGVCPFCPEHRRRWHLKEDVWSGVHWVVSDNMWPYEWTKDGGRHFMLFLKTHAENAADIPTGAWEELGTVAKIMESRFDIPGGGIYMRFGEPIWTGATIRHIHGHIAQKREPHIEAVFYL
ncbi:dihydrofolate reductase [Candidatus Parcubacteria bacterium]|nr:dihydrofolate reductase [Candidatus Parcubacteria bacterium]